MTQWNPPAPEERVYVIGDVHGCVDRLGALLERIDDDIAATAGGPGRVVFVGDYVDRGHDSAECLQFMAQVTRDFPEAMVGLQGNHERMMLDFLADPTGPAKRWLRYGGLQTLASFGVGRGLGTDQQSTGDLMDAAGDLRDAMGPELIGWVEGLATTWQSGTLWVVHAGADPARPMAEQETRVLLWGDERFLTVERTDGQWVAFGHQPFEKPFAASGRIAVDTGAVYGGKLSAARIDPDGTTSFISV